jgi:hypothetical protein
MHAFCIPPPPPHTHTHTHTHTCLQQLLFSLFTTADHNTQYGIHSVMLPRLLQRCESVAANSIPHCQASFYYTSKHEILNFNAIPALNSWLLHGMLTKGYNKKCKDITITGHGRQWKCETRGSHIFTDVGVRSALRSGSDYPSGRFLVLISARSCVDLMAVLRLDGFVILKGIQWSLLVSNRPLSGCRRPKQNTILICNW